MLPPRRSTFPALALAAALATSAALGGLAACSSRSEFRPPWPGGLPLVADVNGDGDEDVITYGSAYGVAAYAGGDYQKPLWARKDLGYAGDMKLAGATLAVARERTLELLDLAGGQTRATLPLSDKVKSLCASDKAVWVHLIDEQKGLVDLASGASPRLDPSGAPPPECAPKRRASFACETASADCPEAPGAASSSPSFILTDPKAQPPTSVTIDIKHPGTPEITLALPGMNGGPPRRVLFDREGHRVDAADLSGKMLFLKTIGIHAIDITTGSTLWTLQCGGNSPALRATPTRLYAVCDGHRQYKVLRVLDHSGKVISDFGESRY